MRTISLLPAWTDITTALEPVAILKRERKGYRSQPGTVPNAVIAQSKRDFAAWAMAGCPRLPVVTTPHHEKHFRPSCFRAGYDPNRELVE